MRRLACGLVFALTACADAGPGDWVQGDGLRWREVRPSGGGGFDRLEAADRGIDFVYDVAESERVANRVLAEGQGVAVGDVDSDGLPDLFLAGFGVPSRLYRNLGGWQFEDVTAGAGLGLEDVPARGAALVDLDGDANLDLVVTVHGQANLVYRGDGAGSFERLETGMTEAWGSTTPTLADIDGDGDLDLYVANYKTRQVDDLFPPDVLDIDRLQPGSDGQIVIPEDLRAIYAAHYEVEFDGRFVRRFEIGEPDELYLNDGAGRFQPVDWGTTFAASSETPDVLAPRRDWGLAARFSDWDADGDPDLYVANDFNSEDAIWINRGDGTFEPVPYEAIRTTSLSSMAIEVGDLDRDGLLDLVTTDMLARDPAERLTQVPNFEARPDPPGRIEGRIQVNRNTVQLNRGDGTFSEAAWQLGLAASDWTWGALLLDADLDGWEDVLVTTGHVWNQLSGDVGARIPPGLPADQALRLFPPLRQPNVAFRGGPTGFTDVGETWGWGGEADIAHGIASGDFDADGDLDVVVTRFGDPPVLYRNQAESPRVLVRLRGAAPNTGGIGAVLRLHGHDVGVQTRELTAGGAYLSSSDPVAAFAAAEGPMVLEVTWPDGAWTRVEDVVPNREYEIEHPGGDAPARERPQPEAPLFADVSGLVAHRHVESPFDDRQRQPLLPHSLDRLGPGVSWIDVESDGDPDLIVGTGRGGAPVLFRNSGTGFETARAVSPALDYDATAIVPFETETRTGLVIGTSAYEARSVEEARATPPALVAPLGSGGARPSPLVPSPAAATRPPTATGPLARADIDGDGDLDVFVGGRVVPGLYPVPGDSWLFLNDGAELRADFDRSEPFRDIGMVSGAVFSDIDVDGDPDLILALSWGPIRVFENDLGSFRDATAERGLAESAGRWNGVAVADFDGDGRPDFVATGWGTNLEVTPPYGLLYGDMNRDGLMDVVEARSTAEGWIPLRGRDALARPILDPVPGLRSLLGVPYAEYAALPLETLLGGLDPGIRHDVRELRHTAFLNRGDRFEAVVLPPMAQRAPALGVAAGDLNGDGHEDVILSQNFYAGRAGVPRYDAGRGLVLLGDGTGAFTPVDGAVSGIRVYGDGRAVALADYDLDGRVDVAVGVNGGPIRLFHNRGGTPGIRVVLQGLPGNRSAVGARLRIEYEDGTLGPAREVTSGGGYWAHDELAQTLGVSGTPSQLHVSWPGGSQTVVPIDGQRVLTVSIER